MSGLGFRVLEISDGTRAGTVSLLHEPTGFCCIDWRPAISAPKRGGIWHGSPLVGGRSPVLRTLADAIETLTLSVRDWSQDDVIRDTITLRTLLEKATQYWTTRWQNTPVYIKAQGRRETNARYSIIKDYRTPEDGFPYGEPFDMPNCMAAMERWPLIITREPFWRSEQPGTATCAPISAVESYCHPSFLVFDGVNDEIDCTNNGILDDLHDAALTVEAWIRPDGYGQNSEGRIVSKEGATSAVGWIFRVRNTTGLEARIICATAFGESVSGLDDFTADGLWHHVAFTWNDATFNFPRLWIDGVEPSYASTQNRNGAIVSDVAVNLWIATRNGTDRFFEGGIGWTRVSNTVRYTGTFTPPARCVLPDPTDANTVAQWISEGEGATTYNQANVGTANGTIANGAWWDCDCPRHSGNYTPCGPAYLEFDALTTDIDCGSDGSLDNLSDAAFTIDGWIRANSYGENSLARIMTKESVPENWILQLDSPNGLYGFVDCATTDSEAWSGAAAFSPDSEWHHVAMTWDDAQVGAARIVKLFIDGVEPAAYHTHTAGIGVVSTYPNNDVHIGNIAAGTRTFDGGIGWMRLSDVRLWDADFTPPARCTIPTVIASTLGLWIREGIGTIAYNIVGTADTDGAITDGVWHCDCTDGVGRETTCDEEVYVANKRNTAQLTHIFYYDAGTATFSGNLLTAAPPYRLLPTVPASAPDDYVYFGIDTTLVDSGPFCSLVFDLIPQTGITAMTWEYIDGSGPITWRALTVHDNTNADGAGTGVEFDTAGVKSVHWEPPSDFPWLEETINTVTGYWVRCHVDAAGGAATAPWQQNRHPYTVIWPYIELQAADVGGNIAALAQIRLRNQVDNIISDDCAWEYLYCGIRSISRGADFTAYINLSDEQNPSYISMTWAGAGLGEAIDVIAAPSGRCLSVPNAAVGMNTKLTIAIDEDYTPQFYGTFRVFLRGEQINGGANDVTCQLVYSTGFNTLTTDPKPLPLSISDFAYTDFGQVTIPLGNEYNPTDEVSFSIAIQCSGTAPATSDAYLYDLILIPIDEWAGDFSNPAGLTPGVIYQRATSTLNNVLDIDSILRPKSFIRTPVRIAADLPHVTGQFTQNTTARMIWQANARQRLWIFVAGYEGDAGETARPEDVQTAWAWKTQRYFSMRGQD